MLKYHVLGLLFFDFASIFLFISKFLYKKAPGIFHPRAKNILYVNCDFNEKSCHTLYFLLFEVKNHFLLIAACAAAKRAIGTRKGEQDT